MTVKRTALAALAMGALVAGCGTATAQDPGAGASPSQATSGSAAGTPRPTPAMTLASKDFTADGEKFQVQVYQLQRNDGLVQLELGVKNPATTEDPKDPGVTFFYEFGRGRNADASGVALVDTKGKKKYLPALYGDECLCSKNLWGTQIRPGQTFFITVNYAEVPADLKNVDIQLASLGTITDVPLQ